MNHIILLIALVVPASAWLPWISSRRVTSTALLDKISSSGLVDHIEENIETSTGLKDHEIVRECL